MISITFPAPDVERLGLRLFGPDWRARLAEALGVSRQTLWRQLNAGALSPTLSQRLREIAAVAPPPGTSDDQDRDEACADVLAPELGRLIETACTAGWDRGEVVTALFSLLVSDIRDNVGNGAVLDLCWQVERAIRAGDHHRQDSAP